MMAGAKTDERAATSTVWTLSMMGVASPIGLAAMLRGLSFLLPMIRGL
jgi:hypothetical protein